jgi:hypothetical protein
LSGWARQQGLSVSPADVDAALVEWAEATGGPRDDQRMRADLEDALLEALALEHAARMLPDGQGEDEALASEARLRGLWHDTARRLATKKRR